MPKRMRDGQHKLSSKSQVVTQDDAALVDLEKEILALGGSKEDYDLIMEVPSDSEYEVLESAELSEKSLPKDLRRLVKELGIEKAAAQNPVDDIPSSQESEDAQSKGQGSGVEQKKEHFVKTGSGKSRFPPQSEWHSAQLPPLTAVPDLSRRLPLELAERVHAHAQSLLEAENKEYGSHENIANSAHQFYSTIMSSGTLSDKISALTLSVQESPLHNMKALETLLTLASKRSRSQAVEVLGALKDLFGPGALLPSDRKLRHFANQPGLSIAFARTELGWKATDPLPKPLKEIHLISWAYEDWLKSIYFEVIKIIETWCNDEVVFARGKAVDHVFQLLREKPEQEANLLRLLVNKLGDSDKKIASKTSYNILQLQIPHPLMKSTIISAIESDLLFRPGQSLHAKYYAIITLNQTTLSVKQDDVTKQLLNIYFNLFTQLLTKSTILPSDDIVINKMGDVQGGGGTMGRKAQKKLALQERSTATNDQLREKVISAILTGVNRAMPYTNTNDEAFEKHMDTLFKVTHSSNFNTSIQALMLIQQLVAGHVGSSDRFYRTLYESLLDPRLLTTSKQALYLNLLFKALRSDLSVKRVKAFVKRLLQVVSLHQPSFACAAIYLIRELEAVFPNLRAFIDQAEEGESDEEELFEDALDPDGVSSNPRKVTGINKDDKRNLRKLYDGRKRDPQHSHAEYSCFWEIAPLVKHFHPSVSLFISRLTSGDTMPPKPDLASNTLAQFLDRFVYRNPKITTKSRGASTMQPLLGGDASGLLVSALSKNRSRVPVNSEAFAGQDIGKVAPDEVFFHRYFSTVGRGKEKARRKKERKRLQHAEGSDAAEDEDEIWQALVRSRPELEEDSDAGMDSDLPEHMDNGTDSVGSEDLRNSPAAIDERSDSGEDCLDFDDDEGALIGSDDDLPDDLAMALEEEEASNDGEARHQDDSGKGRRAKKRKMKSLPTFASADDYWEMLKDDD
ncbi:MAG: hypothetical protein Q9195_003908 [Heterodermia aff. obscurata]